MITMSVFEERLETAYVCGAVGRNMRSSGDVDDSDDGDCGDGGDYHKYQSPR